MPPKKNAAASKARKAKQENSEPKKAMPKKNVDESVSESDVEKPAAGNSRTKAAPNKGRTRRRKQDVNNGESDAQAQSEPENSGESGSESAENDHKQGNPRGRKLDVDSNESDEQSQSEAQNNAKSNESETVKLKEEIETVEEESPVKVVADQGKLRRRKTVSDNDESDAQSQTDQEDDGDGDGDNETKNEPVRSEVVAKKGNARGKKHAAVTKIVDSDEDGPTPKMPHSQSANESKEPKTTDSLPKKTVAETVSYAAKYLVSLEGKTSLVMLKRYLLSECGEIYVTRNYDRVKTELKEMFKREEIHPVHRRRKHKKQSVAVLFSFEAAKKASRRKSLVEEKMVQKKANAKAAKKKKEND